MKYRIGSFNMKNFGAYPSRDFKKIAEIIHGEKMDIVAFQEVLSEGKGVQRLLEENVRRRFSSWGFCWASPKDTTDISKLNETSVYKGYKQDKIEMRGDRAEMSDFPLYLNTVAGGLDRRDQTIGGFSFVVKIYAVPVVEIIG